MSDSGNRSKHRWNKKCIAPRLEIGLGAFGRTCHACSKSAPRNNDCSSSRAAIAALGEAKPAGANQRAGRRLAPLREASAAHPSISSLALRLILVDPRGYEGTDEAQHEPAAVMATKSTDQEWPPPPIKSKCLEPVSSRYVRRRGSSVPCAQFRPRPIPAAPGPTEAVLPNA